MEQSECVDKLIPALLKARKAIKPAKKGSRNQFDKYNYATQEDWHDAVMPSLLENGLVLGLSTIAVEHLESRPTKKGGTEYVVQVQCSARLWHVSGQWIEVQGAGVGQDRADKGIYQAMTGAAKYLYAQLFALPTVEDPEKFHKTGDGNDASPTAAPPQASNPDQSVEDLI